MASRYPYSTDRNILPLGFRSGPPVRSPAARGTLTAMRLLLAWTFIWPFLDKMFGLGFGTKSGQGVVDGGSPTLDFLEFGTKGPCKDLFASVAGAVWLDALFMFALLGIGLAFLLGIGLRVAAAGNLVLMFLMWLVTLRPAWNPVTDGHWLLALAGLVVAATHSGDTFGLGRWWKSLDPVRRAPWPR